MERTSYHQYLWRQFRRPSERLIRVHVAEILTHAHTVSIGTFASSAEWSQNLSVRSAIRSPSTGKYYDEWLIFPNFNHFSPFFAGIICNYRYFKFKILSLLWRFFKTFRAGLVVKLIQSLHCHELILLFVGTLPHSHVSNSITGFFTCARISIDDSSFKFMWVAQINQWSSILFYSIYFSFNRPSCNREHRPTTSTPL